MNNIEIQIVNLIIVWERVKTVHVIDNNNNNNNIAIQIVNIIIVKEWVIDNINNMVIQIVNL